MGGNCVSKPHIWASALVAAACFATVAVPTVASASQYPASIHALPNPPGAPGNDTFLVTVPHHRVVPVRAVFRFTNRSGQGSTNSLPFKKLNQYQWMTVYRAGTEGRLTVDVYSAQHQLLAAASYPVAKSKNSPVGRLVIGALFIGISLWFWWRQQRFYRRH